MDRRNFLQLAGAIGAPMAAVPGAMGQGGGGGRFRISLAQWSLHKAIQSRMVANLQFPRIAREQFGIEGLEFVNTLMEPPIASNIQALKKNMAATGTKGVLIMVDGEGYMGAVDKAERLKAAENHFKWVDTAAELGCHAIRTNMYPGQKQPSSEAEIATFLDHCAESFAKLCEYAKGRNINVIIENHGGVSSNPDVVVRLMKKLPLPNFGTLPDFGNFPKEVDRYDAVKKMMAYAKGVSFKCMDFDGSGKETTMDCDRLMGIVGESAYRGYVGIEYEGSRLTEFEGIQAARRFLTKYAS
ncbi:MAG: sugar phosphate isomerase/epimerase [Acidobacteria bacterium]|nr:sugar phosphate isomerase/epimerase [Acidobacteriota bacterium]